jgi:preprotein translocase subunit SecE
VLAEPTKHGMPHVEEAHMAETGPTELDEDFDGAPDEVEGDLVPAARPGAAERAAHARPRKRRSGVIGFLGHCVDELKRVQWPDRRQVGQGTAVTLGFTVLAGGYLGLLDAIWKPLVEAIL